MAIPVILDTDIGLDVDDVWALVFMLKCPEPDAKLITTDTGDTHYAARLVAKLLGIAERAIYRSVSAYLSMITKPLTLNGLEITNWKTTLVKSLPTGLARFATRSWVLSSLLP